MITRTRDLGSRSDHTGEVFLLRQAMNQLSSDLKIDLSEILWFDLETTGLSPAKDAIYLIGCMTFHGDSFICTQYMTESPSDEVDVLLSFLSLCEGKKVLMHFNGDTFDIPFVNRRLSRYGKDPLDADLLSYDILKKIRPYKKMLGLTSCRQKEIERYLGIDREDLYTGGELIEVYHAFEHTHTDRDYDLLILHNAEDMSGMLALTRVLAIPLFFEGGFCSIDANAVFSDAELPMVGTTLTAVGHALITAKQENGVSLPKPISILGDSFYLRAANNQLLIQIDLFRGELKHFYPDVKNYYYLPEEDMAVHKSIGEYVEKEHRKKATKETCYTKKTGLFAPQPSVTFEPAFSEHCRSKEFFFSFCEDAFQDTEKTLCFLRDTIKKAMNP